MAILIPNLFGAELNQLSLEHRIMTTWSTPDLDTIYHLLSASRRRYVLYDLVDSEPTNVDRLALRIAAAEQTKAIEQVTADEAERVTTSLRDIYLPRLADHEIIASDPRSDDLVTGRNFERLQATIEHARDAEPVDLARDHPTESVLFTDPVTESTSNDS
ncbi:hypothetical protein C485_12548 [Natrinema altunense JCM 12890]|uniref:DUF7344 domain-containing protein n=1 Tax=Natrinema altunense (strain JCM 12890 / CGMCC 1.3731 / AJ2) TaxID=1227494 RepID=L9ZLL0_NATA2|nr:hypothetical protein C485_12548 [Natrinema altunense JCM 12890]